MAKDWTEDPEKLNLAFRVLDTLTFSAAESTEDIVIDTDHDPATPARTDWQNPTGGRWCDTGYIAGLDDTERPCPSCGEDMNQWTPHYTCGGLTFLGTRRLEIDENGNLGEVKED
jgi:hypothetical protein